MKDEKEVVVADDGFFDFMFDMEWKALEDIGDTEALAIQEVELRDAQAEYERELNDGGLTSEDAE